MLGQARGTRGVAPSQQTPTATIDRTTSQVVQLGVSVVQDSRGIRVVAVDPQGPVAQAPQIAPGDYINAVDGVEVHTVAELNSALSANKSGTARVQYQVKGWYQSEREVTLRG